MDVTVSSPSKIAVCTLLSETRLVEAVTTGEPWLAAGAPVELWDNEPVPIVAPLATEPICEEPFAELVAPLVGAAERGTPVPAAAPPLEAAPLDEGLLGEAGLAAVGVADQEPLGGV